MLLFILLACVFSKHVDLRDVWDDIDIIPKKIRAKGYNETVARYYLTPTQICLSNKCSSIVPEKKVAGIDPADIAKIGKALWQVVQDNQAVVNYTEDWAGAVPDGIKDWTELENFKEQTTGLLYFEFRNAVNIKLTRFAWTYAWKYGGSYQGVGQYVTQAGPALYETYAYLTEHVDVSSSALKPVNYGSKASPVAGIDIEVKMTSYGAFERTTVGCTYSLKGDGSHSIVSCQNGTHPAF